MAHTKTEGTLLRVGDGTTPTEVFTALGQLFSIDPPEASAEEVDQTELASATRKSRPSAIPEPGEMSFVLYCDPADAQQIALEAAFWAGTPGNYQLVYNNGTASRPADTFPGWLKSIKRGEADPEGGDLTFEVTLKVNGKPVRSTVTIS